MDVWGALLNLPLILGGVIFIPKVEAQLILGTTILSLLVAGQIHRKRPLARLIGICHVVWLPLIPFLIYRLRLVDFSTMYELWIMISIALMSASILLDAMDIYRYFLTDNKTHDQPAT